MRCPWAKPNRSRESHGKIGLTAVRSRRNPVTGAKCCFCGVSMKRQWMQWRDRLNLPLDRAAGIALGILLVGVGGVLAVGDRTLPQVQQWSWAEQRLSANHDHFLLDFNRAMDWDSVAQQLSITPELPGQGAGRGQRFAYTLDDIPAYGTEYMITLDTATDQPRTARQSARIMVPFSATVRSRDRILAYIGVEANESGRLVLYNMTRERKQILTPPDLVVTNFRSEAQGDRILFFAFEKGDPDGLSTQQLYRITTAFDRLGDNGPPPGQITRLLDAEEYQNIQFDLATQSGVVILERVNRQNPADGGLWLLPPEGEAQPLGIQGESFKISPDGQVLAISDRNGVTILPLTATADTREFFPAYEGVIAFDPQDHRVKVMVKPQGDTARSLVLLNAKGRERELLTTAGFILACNFEPRHQTFLYCLQTERLDTEQAILTPFITVINLQTGREVPLVALTNDLNVRMDMAPDGRYLVFDQVIDAANADETERDRNSTAFPPGSLWILPLPNLLTAPMADTLDPPERLAPGLDPQWLP